MLYKTCIVLMIVWAIGGAFALLVGIFAIWDSLPGYDNQDLVSVMTQEFNLGQWLMYWLIPVVVLGIMAMIAKPRGPRAQSLDEPDVCPSCGRGYAKGSRYCANCGAEIEGAP